jgi:hypothetical protein
LNVLAIRQCRRCRVSQRNCHEVDPHVVENGNSPHHVLPIISLTEQVAHNALAVRGGNVLTRVASSINDVFANTVVDLRKPCLLHPIRSSRLSVRSLFRLRFGNRFVLLLLLFAASERTHSSPRLASLNNNADSRIVQERHDRPFKRFTVLCEHFNKAIDVAQIRDVVKTRLVPECYTRHAPLTTTLLSSKLGRVLPDSLRARLSILFVLLSRSFSS